MSLVWQTKASYETGDNLSNISLDNYLQ